MARHCPRSHHRSSCTIASAARHLSPAVSLTPRHRFSKAKAPCGFPKSTRSLFHVRAYFLLPVDFTDGGGTTVPLSGGLFGFVALRCYAQECAFSLSTQAQDHVRDLAEYKRVEPAHCPTGATSGGAGCEGNVLCAYQTFRLRTRFVLCMTGVLELDLACVCVWVGGLVG